MKRLSAQQVVDRLIAAFLSFYYSMLSLSPITA